MGKWLTGVGIVLLVILIVLWRQLQSSSATPAPVTEPARAVAVSPPTPAPATAAAPVERVGAPAPPGADKPKKMDPNSDEFQLKHDEMVVPRLSREAVKCIEGKVEKLDDRNKSVVLKFKQKVRDGRVQITDVEVESSSIDDAALQACFIQQIRSAGWTDERMPDWDQDDQIKLGFRQLKKYTRENREYEGAEAPPMMPKPADH